MDPIKKSILPTFYNLKGLLRKKIIVAKHTFIKIVYYNLLNNFKTSQNLN